MTGTRITRLLPLALVASLAACASTDVSRSFGLVRDAPDEFVVTTRAPLSMPPDYNLRPPRPGAPRPQEAQASAGGLATVAPQTALAERKPGPESRGEQALLSQAGPVPPQNIRALVDEDAAMANKDRSFTDRLLFWKSPPPPGTVVDAQAESQRLRENAALGQPVGAGETPIIQPKKGGLFGF